MIFLAMYGMGIAKNLLPSVCDGELINEMEMMKTPTSTPSPCNIVSQTGKNTYDNEVGNEEEWLTNAVTLKRLAHTVDTDAELVEGKNGDVFDLSLKGWIGLLDRDHDRVEAKVCQDAGGSVWVASGPFQSLGDRPSFCSQIHDEVV